MEWNEAELIFIQSLIFNIWSSIYSIFRNFIFYIFRSEQYYQSKEVMEEDRRPGERVTVVAEEEMAYWATR